MMVRSDSSKLLLQKGEPERAKSMWLKKCLFNFLKLIIDMLHNTFKPNEDILGEREWVRESEIEMLCCIT